MGAVADITKYVKPKLEEARAEGRAEGRTEGRTEGRAEGRTEVALGLLREGVSLEVISKTTGLSTKEINKLR